MPPFMRSIANSPVADFVQFVRIKTEGEAENRQASSQEPRFGNYLPASSHVEFIASVKVWGCLQYQESIHS